MTTTAARVEVLTAEVRVLMVGSRQVTLSVYGQLDQVQPGEIEPFGRVQPRDAEQGYTYVVGASVRVADGGALVRSRRESSRALIRQADGRHGRADLIVERGELRRQRHEALERAEDWDWLNTVNKRLDQLDRLLSTESRTVEELYDEAAGLTEAAEVAARWDALPLIVLAGLR
jgi:hypothetical protein